MGRITPSPRQLYEATVEDLRRFYRGALIDSSHRTAFDLLLRDAWESEQAAMANSNIPVVIDRMNLTANVHNRKLLDALLREVQAKEAAFKKINAELAELKGRKKSTQGGGGG